MEEIMIRAIETTYSGYKFRSRLEARWAVFFDALQIVWQYEPEGYVLSDGTHYLPDFYLPTFDYDGMWAEVKPLGGDFIKARQFYQDSKQAMWLCEGPPDCRTYTVLCYVNSRTCPDLSICPHELGIFALECARCNKAIVDSEEREYVGIPNFDQAWRENRMFVDPGYENEDGTISPEYYQPHYQRAVLAARQARFEYGEKG